MDLILDNWTPEKIAEFKMYEQTIKSDEKDCEWEQRIVNTKQECFGRTSAKAKDITKQICKGNFLSFLDNLKIENHLESLIYSYLICKIKDFDLFEKYLDKFVGTIDNWASSDTLTFKKRDKEKLFTLAKKYLKDERTFVRRTGVNIFFELIKDKKYLDYAFKLLNSLKDEQEYYVNMCGAWLLSFCFIDYRNETLEFFKNHSTNDFIINKGISKCRDSFRVSQEDKDLLLEFKIKKNKK